MLIASLSDDIPREHVHRSLGHIALMEKNIDNAIIEYQEELKHFEDPKLRLKLAKIHEQRKDWTNAAKEHCSLRKLTLNSVHPFNLCTKSIQLRTIRRAVSALKPAQQMAPEGPFVLLLAANIG